MTETLAKIELPGAGPRGPDVEFAIVVPAEWLRGGDRILVNLPARLACASCSGGGCDACARSGAFDLPKAEAPLELSLPMTEEPHGVVRIRLPGLGAEATESLEPRGQLILSVRVGSEASRGVRLLEAAPIKPTRADPALALRILIMVVCVTVLFFLLLRFSGWM